MIVLGVDPGIASVGYGVIEYKSSKFKALEYGTFHTAAGERHSRRLLEIYEFLRTLASKYPIDAMSRGAVVFFKQRNNRHSGRPRAGCHPSGGGAVRVYGGRIYAGTGQTGRRRLRPGREKPGAANGEVPAGAHRAAAPGRHGRCACGRHLSRAHGREPAVEIIITKTPA